MEQVSIIVSQATREWRRLGVLPQTRRDLAAELEADIAAAVGDGRPASDVTGTDVTAFARDWAYARGDVPVRAYYWRSFVSSWIGVFAGGLVAIGLIAFLSEAREFFDSGANGINFDNGGEPLLLAYLWTGLGGYLGALSATWLGLSRRDDPFVRRTVVALTWTLGVGAGVAIGVGVGTAASLHYPVSFHSFVVAEIILVLSVLSAAVVAARRIAVGTPTLLAGPGQAGALAPVDVSL